jgi:predicted metal-dependent phosphotriesterase family hydrolase
MKREFRACIGVDERGHLPRLREAGIDDEALHLMTVDNPRRMLSGQ